MERQNEPGAVVATPSRDQIERLEGILLQMEVQGAGVAIDTWHHFADGLVTRTILIPAGTMLTGAAHKAEHLNIAHGDITVWTEAGMRRLTRQCTYQAEVPNVLLCGEDLYDAHQAWAEEKLQLRIGDIKDSAGWGDYEMFDFNGRTIMYSQAMPAKTGWLLNMKRTKVRIHRGTNFTFESWQMLPSKVAKKRDCLTYAAVYTKRRNANGVITFT